MAKKKASAATAVVKKPAKKPAAKKPAGKTLPKQVAEHAGCDHDHANTFLAVYDESPGLVVLFDAMIHHQGGSDKVTLGDVRECLKGMNETMARFQAVSAKTTLQKIEYLESLPK